MHFMPQIHVCRLRFGRMQKAVIARPADARHLTHLDHTHASFLADFFLDRLVDDAAPLFTACSRRCSSKCCKALFKKSISMVCWPILRSSSATFDSSARLCPEP